MIVHGTVVAVCHRLLKIRTISVVVIDVPCAGNPRLQDMERPSFAGGGDGL